MGLNEREVLSAELYSPQLGYEYANPRERTQLDYLADSYPPANMVDKNGTTEKQDGIYRDLSYIHNGDTSEDWYTLTCVQSLKYGFFVTCFVK